MFGKNAEHLVVHAWGIEPATIADIRSHVPRGRSLSNGQLLMRDYTFAEARTVLRKMVYGSRMDLTEKGLACGSVGLYVGHSSRAEDGAGPRTPVDRTGRAASLRLSAPSPASCLGRTTGP